MMTKKDKILLALKDAGGTLTRTHLFRVTLQKNTSGAKIEALMNSELSGLVELKKEQWTLTTLGWAEANALASAKNPPEEQPTQEGSTSKEFSRFKEIARENPDASPQRLLQLAGRHLPSPLDSDWNGATDWWENYPRGIWASDVELDQDGYPVRYPTRSLAPKEQRTRPTSERGWFDFAMAQPGSSLEPFSTPMPVYEVAQVLKVSRKVGKPAALEIFGEDRIRTALELAGVRKTR